MDRDARGFRVALLADEYVNVDESAIDGLAILEQAGWGVMQLPPASYPDDLARPMLEQIAEQVEEFVRHGYDVILVGARPGLEEALAALGVAVPARLVPSSEGELSAFLAARPVPTSAPDRGS
jgi:hypothetical protein